MLEVDMACMTRETVPQQRLPVSRSSQCFQLGKEFGDFINFAIRPNRNIELYFTLGRSLVLSSYFHS